MESDTSRRTDDGLRRLAVTVPNPSNPNHVRINGVEYVRIRIVPRRPQEKETTTDEH